MSVLFIHFKILVRWHQNFPRKFKVEAYCGFKTESFYVNNEIFMKMSPRLAAFPFVLCFLKNKHYGHSLEIFTAKKNLQLGKCHRKFAIKSIPFINSWQKPNVPAKTNRIFTRSLCHNEITQTVNMIEEKYLSELFPAAVFFS